MLSAYTNTASVIINCHKQSWIPSGELFAIVHGTSNVGWLTCAPSQVNHLLLWQMPLLVDPEHHMSCHFSAAIGHVSPQCHPCEQEIDLNGFPPPSRRPCAAVCMCRYLSVDKALTSCLPPPAFNLGSDGSKTWPWIEWTTLLWWETELDFFFFIQILKPYESVLSPHPPVISRISWM